MLVPIESIMTAVVIGFWMALATWFFYWLFLIGASQPNDKAKRDFYFWGWLRFVLFTLMFTVGYAFFITDNKDWASLVDFVSVNTSKIVAVLFWVTAIVFLGYFLIYRGIKRRRTIQF